MKMTSSGSLSYSFRCHFVLLLWLASRQLVAESQQFLILDDHNQPLAGVVVSIPGAYYKNFDKRQIFVMDQIDKQFDPHVLPIPLASRVSFPNSDSIKHHVYSFSKAKTFELKLYKKDNPEPISFQNLGIVELGCNVHDWMLGYILVLDSHVYGITDENGELRLTMPEHLIDSNFAIEIWHPRFKDNRRLLRYRAAFQKEPFVVTIDQSLRPPVDNDEFTDDFSYD